MGKLVAPFPFLQRDFIMEMLGSNSAHKKKQSVSRSWKHIDAGVVGRVGIHQL
jgi:hypothetical protein